MDSFIPSSYKPGKKSSQKWLNLQCAKAVKHKNYRFTQWKLHQTPPLKNNSDSPPCSTSSKAKIFASTFVSNSNLDDQDFQPPLYPTFTITMSPIKFSTRKVLTVCIPAIVLQSCAHELAPVLNKLFQLSYYLGIFPSSWKRTHVFPFSKKGDKSDPSNYRPIAITSLISKTMEAIITKQLLVFLETNNLLSDHQYGFRQARSTGDLLANAVHAWSSTLESYGESRVTSLDTSKAFDHVSHKCLLAKLPMFGLHRTLIKWISSFLSDRSIAIRVDGYLSNPHSINSGDDTRTLSHKSSFIPRTSQL